MAGHKTWAIGEEVIASDFGPFVADQIVAVYATAAARTAGWPSPPVGAVSVRLDNLPNIEMWNGTAWVLLTTGPHGRIFLASNIGCGAGVTQLTPMTVEALRGGMTSPANNLVIPVTGIYRVQWNIMFQAGGPNTFVQAFVYKGAGGLLTASTFSTAAGQYPGPGATASVPLTAGDVLTLQANIQASGCTAQAGAPYTWLSATFVTV